MLKFSRWFLSHKKVIHSTLITRVKHCNFCSISANNESKRKLEYLLILDFEATCDNVKKGIQEIIEFPCIKMNLTSLKEEGRFHHYVRPVINPTLSNFCIDLTGIIQEMVDDEKTFPEVFELFEQWRLDEGLTEDNSLYVTSGDWDLGHMLPVQCELCNIQPPSHMNEWIDIKKLFANETGKYFDAFIHILHFYKLNFQGRQHSGIDDCLNIFNVVQKLAMNGAEFRPTSKLQVINYKRRVLNPSINHFK